MKQQYIVVVDHFRTEVPRTCGECPAGEECWEETQDFCPGARAPMPAWAIVLIAACIVAAAAGVIVLARKARERAAMEAHHQAMEARQQLETDTQPAAKQWTTFLSHHKKDGGSTAKHFRKTFEQRLDGKHYLDVDELTNITVRKNMTDVRSADVLVLLLVS